MDNSSDEISIESDPSKGSSPGGLKYVRHWPPVNIEFQDLVYSVPDVQGKFVYLSFSSSFPNLFLSVPRLFNPFHKLSSLV